MSEGPIKGGCAWHTAQRKTLENQRFPRLPRVVLREGEKLRRVDLNRSPHLRKAYQVKHLRLAGN